jgi:hypothetical protein
LGFIGEKEKPIDIVACDERLAFERYIKKEANYGYRIFNDWTGILLCFETRD